MANPVFNCKDDRIVQTDVKTSFDKHKSWYYLDVETDKTKTYTPKKKMVKPKPVSSIYVRPKNLQTKASKIVPDVPPPKEISYVHELGMKLAIHIGVFLVFILSSLCGVSYLWPVRVAKSKPKVQGVF